MITESPKEKVEEEKMVVSPRDSPKQKDWHEVKEKVVEETKKTPSKLDLVRAKLAEATKGKDRLGRPLLFNKSPSKPLFVIRFFFFFNVNRSILVEIIDHILFF